MKTVREILYGALTGIAIMAGITLGLFFCIWVGGQADLLLGPPAGGIATMLMIAGIAGGIAERMFR